MQPRPLNRLIATTIVLLLITLPGCGKGPATAESDKAPDSTSTSTVAADGSTRRAQEKIDSIPKKHSTASGAAADAHELSVNLGGGVALEMVLLPAGEFMMGSPDSDKDAQDQEKPQHRVRITKPFYLGKYLVTQEQWQAVMDKNPSRFQGPKNPVENVSPDDCQVFLDKLNAKAGAEGGKFGLPTEAQWEYACRAGSTTKFCFGDDEARLGDYAWYEENASNKTHPVGSKKPNAWGLFDMHGNVWQWCRDCYGDNYYANSPKDDPTGPETRGSHVYRGGCWRCPANTCRSAIRSLGGHLTRSDVIGLRVCRIPAEFTSEKPKAPAGGSP